MRHALGLDLPLPLQYGKWLLRTATGDFGISVATQLNVATLVLPRFLNTLLLTVASLFLSVVVGYSIGLLAALRAQSVFDRATMTVTLLAGSAPPFWLGLILVLLFAIRLRWLPVSGMVDMAGDGGALDLLRHLILPAVNHGAGPCGDHHAHGAFFRSARPWTGRMCASPGRKASRAGRCCGAT